MKTYSFLNRELSANQRQLMEQRKRIEQADLQAIKALNESLEAIQKLQAFEKVQACQQKPFKQWELDKEQSFFEKSPSMCLVHDENYIDHTKKHYY